jgi:uncharacterized PurR-regulated membrane protein YhhQ (DUF165 family)
MKFESMKKAILIVLASALTLSVMTSCTAMMGGKKACQAQKTSNHR